MREWLPMRQLVPGNVRETMHYANGCIAFYPSACESKPGYTTVRTLFQAADCNFSEAQESCWPGSRKGSHCVAFKHCFLVCIASWHSMLFPQSLVLLEASLRGIVADLNTQTYQTLFLFSKYRSVQTIRVMKQARMASFVKRPAKKACRFV